MKTELFDYQLPEELIAQFPTRDRSTSRLMIVDRADSSIKLTKFSEITKYITSRDALVVNNTKVFKARIEGRRSTGGKIELLLVRRIDSEREAWKTLVKPARRIKPGQQVEFGERGRVTLEADLGDGYWQVTFSSKTSREKIIAAFGHVPLPPYISRTDQPADLRRYQTVYAGREKVGAIAAPTAGFHFTRKLLDQIEATGAKKLELTLHVGPGTFRPISAENIADHLVEPEQATLTPEVAKNLNQIKSSGGAVFAVGTTSVRTLESATTSEGEIQPLERLVDLYIRPGHKFRAVDHLLTNFHLPKSSLLVLVAAFASQALMKKAYQRAIDEKFRFYSYGDAMLIL